MESPMEEPTYMESPMYEPARSRILIVTLRYEGLNSLGSPVQLVLLP